MTVFFFIFRRSLQISHARRAWVPPFLKYGAMLSGDIIGESGESKGVVLWLLDRLPHDNSALVTATHTAAKNQTKLRPQPGT